MIVLSFLIFLVATLALGGAVTMAALSVWASVFGAPSIALGFFPSVFAFAAAKLLLTFLLPAPVSVVRKRP